MEKCKVLWAWLETGRMREKSSWGGDNSYGTFHFDRGKVGETNRKRKEEMRTNNLPDSRRQSQNRDGSTRSTRGPASAIQTLALRGPDRRGRERVEDESGQTLTSPFISLQSSSISSALSSSDTSPSSAVSSMLGGSFFPWGERRMSSAAHRTNNPPHLLFNQWVSWRIRLDGLRRHQLPVCEQQLRLLTNAAAQDGGKTGSDESRKTRHEAHEDVNIQQQVDAWENTSEANRKFIVDFYRPTKNKVAPDGWNQDWRSWPERMTPGGGSVCLHPNYASDQP